jgi:hypothetical protein
MAMPIIRAACAARSSWQCSRASNAAKPRSPCPTGIVRRLMGSVAEEQGDQSEASELARVAVAVSGRS